MKNLNSFKRLLSTYGTSYIMDVDYIDCLGNVQTNWATLDAMDVLLRVGAKNFLSALRVGQGIQIDYNDWSGAYQIAFFN